MPLDQASLVSIDKGNRNLLVKASSACDTANMKTSHEAARRRISDLDRRCAVDVRQVLAVGRGERIGASQNQPSCACAEQDRRRKFGNSPPRSVQDAVGASTVDAESARVGGQAVKPTSIAVDLLQDRVVQRLEDEQIAGGCDERYVSPAVVLLGEIVQCLRLVARAATFTDP